MPRTMISDDDPIRTRTKDLLGREPIAVRIAEIVLNRPTDASLVLALHGPWGSGKSSVLGLVREVLADKNVVCVEFQPWLFNNVEQLVAMYFSTVQQALVAAGASEKKVRKTLKKFGGLLTAATKYAGIEIDIEKLLDQSPEELRNEICKMSTELAKRIVVMIDDVDRLPLDELALLVKLVRLCGNFPFFTYVLAYDRRVVSASLRTLYQGDSDFLDKIVQVEVPLPPVPPRIIADFVCSGISELGNSLGIDVQAVNEMFEVKDDEMRRELAFIRDNDQPARLIRSLRDAKRLLNGLACTLPLVRHEVDLVDFVQLELVRLFFPTVYDTLYEERFTFATVDAERGADERRNRRQQRHRDFADEIRKLPLGEVAVQILCNVFPVFYAALRAQNQFYGRQGTQNRLMKASDPGHVEKYFQLRVPLDSIPRKDIRDLIDLINAEADATKRKAMFLERVRRFYEDGRLKTFLDAVNTEGDRATPDSLCAMVDALAEAGTLLAERPMEQREMSTAAIGTLWLAKRLGARADEIMPRIVANANRSYVVVLLTYAEPNQYQPSGVGVEFEPMRQAFVERLKFELSEGDVFELYPDEWPQVFMLWRSPADATSYLLGLLAKAPDRWLTLATLPIEQRGKTISIKISDIRPLFTLGDIARDGSAVDTSRFQGNDRKLVEAFVSELRLVPQLIEEIAIIERCARALKDFTPGSPPAIDWATPVWSRARPRLEPVVGSQYWWSSLVQVYNDFSALRADVEQADDLSSPDAEARALARAESLQVAGSALAVAAGEVVRNLGDAVGAQTPLRFELTS